MISGDLDKVMVLMTGIKGKLITIIVIVACSVGMYNDIKDDEYIKVKDYPVNASNYILEEAENGNLNLQTMRLYNDYNYGSYLLYREIPVFIDSRADLYSPEFNEGINIFSDYMNISNIASYYETKFEEYEITHVMMYRNSKLNMIISRDSNYKQLYGDDYFVLYERLSNNQDGE